MIAGGQLWTDLIGWQAHARYSVQAKFNGNSGSSYQFQGFYFLRGSKAPQPLLFQPKITTVSFCLLRCLLVCSFLPEEPSQHTGSYEDAADRQIGVLTKDSACPCPSKCKVALEEASNATLFKCLPVEPRVLDQGEFPHLHLHGNTQRHTLGWRHSQEQTLHCNRLPGAELPFWLGTEPAISRFQGKLGGFRAGWLRKAITVAS